MPATYAHRQSNTLLACDQMNTVYRQLPVPASPNLAHTPHGFRSPATAPAPAMGFTGQRLERYGAYLLGNGYRAYHPQFQRFSSPDSFSPFGTGGINAYAYCGMDPVNRHDPSGHVPWRIGAALLAGTGVLAGTAMVVASSDTGIQTAGGIIAGLSGIATAALVGHTMLKKPKTSTPGGAPNTLGSGVASGPSPSSPRRRSSGASGNSLTPSKLDIEVARINSKHRTPSMTSSDLDVRIAEIDSVQRKPSMTRSEIDYQTALINSLEDRGFRSRSSSTSTVSSHGANRDEIRAAPRIQANRARLSSGKFHYYYGK